VIHVATTCEGKLFFASHCDLPPFLVLTIAEDFAAPREYTLGIAKYFDRSSEARDKQSSSKRNVFNL
jgi:hypothetical protein